MIEIIFGSKGSGKTKKLIADTNSYAAVAKGNVVYITDKPDHSRDVSTAVRFVNIRNYGIECDCQFEGFVSGLIAGNHDIERIFVDRLTSILKMDADSLDKLIASLDQTSLAHQVDFVLTVSCDTLPEKLQKYVASTK